MNTLTPEQRIKSAEEVISFIKNFRNVDPQAVINILLIEKIMDLTDAVQEYINNLYKQN